MACFSSTADNKTRLPFPTNNYGCSPCRTRLQSSADVIAGLSPLLKVPLTFRRLYDASDRTYYLTVQMVAPASA